MRKLMNKKGFSLVELMIVVVIMGILIAVAIPLYGAIQDNANNKTCASNIKTIKEAAVNYKSQHNKSAGDEATLATQFEDGKIPHCPIDDGKYTITFKEDGSVEVACGSIGAANPKHTPEGAKNLPAEAA